MRQLVIIGALALIPGTGATADQPAEWKLAEAEGLKWVARVRKAVSRDNWSVELQGNEITVRCTKPVMMVRIFPGMAEDDKPTPDGKRTIQFVLRFAPKMSMDEHERLAVVNAASEKEFLRLAGKVGLPHKFYEFIATTPEEKERVRAFRAAVAKLPSHTLPDLYTPDHSVYLLLSWGMWSVPADETVAAEYWNVHDTLIRFFGMYNPAAAARGQRVGQYLPEPRR